MAKGAVKLSILSSYNRAGTDQAEQALTRFAKKYGQVNAETKKLELDSTAEKFARQSMAADQAARKLDKVSSACIGVGSSLTKGITVPLVAAGTLTVGAAANMESSFANVRKTLDTTEEGYQRLYDACLSMSTAHPISASDVALIMSLGAQLGISEDALVSFSETVYGMDIATDLDAETAATELAQFANICGTAQTELSNVGSVIVALGNTSATTESHIMDMGMRLAASGTQAGMSEANVLALSAALSSVGMEAEAGGTALSTTINQIDKDVAMNGENLQQWASLAGMSVDEFCSVWDKGGDSTTEAFAKIVQGMASTSDEGGNLTQLLEELGITGIRQSDAMKRLASSGDLLTDSIKTANDAYAENTALGNEVANFEDTLANKWEVTKNKMQAAAITAGGPLCDALSDIIDNAEPLISAVTNAAQAFADMDSGGQKTVLTIAAIAAAAGPSIIGIGKLAAAGSNICKTYAQVTAALARKAAAEAAGTASTTKLGSALSSAGTRVKAFASATNIAKAGIAALAVAVAAFAITQAAEYIRKQKEMETATTGLRNAQLAGITSYQLTVASTQQLIDKTGELGTASQDSASQWNTSAMSVSQSGALYQAATASIDAARESQAQLAQSLQQTFTDVGASNAQLDVYMATIDKLANQTGLSAQEQAQLQVAVDGVNSACGTSYSVIDAENGVLADQSGVILDTTESINQLVEAKKRSAQADALNSAYTETLKAQQEAARGLAEAQQAQKAAQDELNLCLDAGGQGFEVYKTKLDMANQKVTEAQGLYDSASLSAQGYNGQLTLLAMAEQQGAESNAAWLSAHSQVGAIMATNGQDVSAFAQQLDNAGIKMSDFGNVGDATLSAMASNWKGSLTDLANTCMEQGVAIPQSLKDGILSGSPAAVSATGAMKDALVLELAGGDVKLAAELLGHDIDEGLKQGIIDGTSGPQDAISKMSEESKNKAKEMWESHSPSVFMQNLGHDIDEGLANGINDNSGVVSGAITSLMTNAQSFLDGIGESASQAGGDFINFLGGAISNGGQWVADTAGGVVSGAASMAQSFADTTGIGQWFTSTFSGGVGSLLNQATTTAGNVVSGSASKAQSLANTTGIGQFFTSTFSGGINSLIGWATSAAGGVATSAVGSAQGNSNASGGGSWLSRSFAAAISATAGISNAASMAGNATSAAWNNSNASGAGSNLSSSFAGGIDLGAAISAAAQMARNALQAAKDALGIASPSKEFKALARYSVLGFAGGFEDNSYLATRASSDMAQEAVAAAQNELNGGLSIASSSGKAGYSLAEGMTEVEGILNRQYATQVEILRELKQVKSTLGAILTAQGKTPTSEREAARQIQRLAAMNV